MIGLALDTAPPAFVFRLPEVGAESLRHYLGLLHSAAHSMRAQWRLLTEQEEATPVQLSRANGVLDALFAATHPGRAPLERTPAIGAIARILDGDPLRALVCASSYASVIPHDVLHALRKTGAVNGCGVAPGYGLLRDLLSPTDRELPGFQYGHFMTEFRRLERSLLADGPNPLTLMQRASGCTLAEQLGVGLTLQRGLGQRIRFHLNRVVMLPEDVAIARELRYPFAPGRLNEVQALLSSLEREVLTSPPFSNGRVIQAAALYIIAYVLSDDRADAEAVAPIAREAGCLAEWQMLNVFLPPLLNDSLSGIVAPSAMAFRIAQGVGALVRARATRDIEVLDMSRAAALVLQFLRLLPADQERSFLHQLIGYAVWESAGIDLERTPPYANGTDLDPAMTDDEREQQFQLLRIGRLTGLVTDRRDALALLGKNGIAQQHDREPNPIVCGEAPGLSRSVLQGAWRIGAASVRLFQSEPLGQFRARDDIDAIVREIRRSGAYPALNAELEDGRVTPETLGQLFRAESRISLPELERLTYAMRFWRQAPNYQFVLGDFLDIAGSTLVRAKVEHPHEDFLLEVGCRGIKPHTGSGWEHIVDGRTKELRKLSKRPDWPDGFDPATHHLLRFGIIPALATTGAEVPSSRAPEFYAFKTAQVEGSDDLYVSALVARLPSALCETGRRQRSVATGIIHSKGEKMRDFLLREFRGLAAQNGWTPAIESCVAGVNPMIEAAGLRPIVRREVIDPREPPRVTDDPVPPADRSNIAPFSDGLATAHQRPAVASEWLMGNMILPRAAASCVWLPRFVL
jgi:hypothetical protein